MDLSNVNIGDVVVLGTNITRDINKSMEWIVADIQETEVLLISKRNVIHKAYHDERGDITWEKCTLREWLNGEFYDTYFSDEEKARIVEKTIENKGTINHKGEEIPGGEITQDKVFLLSTEEVLRYFTTDEDRIVECDICQERYNKTNDGYWLRSPGYHESDANLIDSNGTEHIGGLYAATENIGVRPAMYVKK